MRKRTDDDPFDAVIAVVSSDGGNGTPFTSLVVLDLVRLSVGFIDGTNQTVL